MLEKDKDYIEFKAAYYSIADYRQYEMTKLEIAGYVNADLATPLPNPGIDYILISKENFERLQAAADTYAATAKQWEKNYNLLLGKTGFDTTEELVNYIYNDGPNSQGDLKTLKEIIDDAEEDYISVRDECDRLQTENERLKNKLEEFSPVPECLVSVNGWEESAKFWKKRYDDIFKLVGFSSKEEVEDYLTNEAEADTLYEAISKLHDQVKYTCDEWKDTNNKLRECEKDYISERDKAEALEKEIGVYSRALKNWKEGTGCPSPLAAKTLIENGPTHIVYLNDPLGVIAQWEKVTGYDKPQDFLKWKVNIEEIMQAWKDRTGCRYPGEAERKITDLYNRIDKMKEAASIASNWTDKIVEG